MYNDMGVGEAAEETKLAVNCESLKLADGIWCL